MNVRFVSGVSPIVDSAAAARRFYGEQLGLPVQAEPDSDYTEVTMDGLKHFGLWTLHDAARSTFERDEWPADVSRPQATIELEVDDVPAAVEELRGPRPRRAAGDARRAVGPDDGAAALAGGPAHRHHLHARAAGE